MKYLLNRSASHCRRSLLARLKLLALAVRSQARLGLAFHRQSPLTVVVRHTGVPSPSKAPQFESLQQLKPKLNVHRRVGTQCSNQALGLTTFENDAQRKLNPKATCRRSSCSGISFSKAAPRCWRPGHYTMS